MALLRNMVTEFFDKERITTTVPKAKELKPFAEKLITLGKRETLHARRQALAVIRRKSVVQKLFDTLASRYADRPGGYTRIIRTGFRKGDSAETAILELVDNELEAAAEPEEKSSKKAGKTKKAAKAEKSKA